jgi:DNA-binding transcriptional MerR regulator
MRHELNQMLTNGKMSRMLGIDPKTLRKWAKRGNVRSYINRVNGYRYYFKAEVLEDIKKVPGSKNAVGKSGKAGRL